MATKDQYDYFKFKYKDEDERNALLTKRAEIYLSLITLVFTGLIFKIPDIKIFCEKNIIFLVIFSMLFASLMITIWFVLDSLRLRNYMEDMDVQEYFKELGDNPPEDSQFFDERISRFIIATPYNFNLNNQRAARLQSAGKFIFVCFTLIGTFILAVIVL